MRKSLLLLFLYFAMAITAMAQETTTYLQNHHSVFTPDQPASYSLLDSAFYQHDVFLLGETHGYAAPQALDLTLLKHLNQRIGLRYYVAEMDGGQAEFVNRYLVSGQTVWLDSLFRGFLRQTMGGTSQWGNQQFYNKIVAIRTYNQTRPDSLRIRFLGIDWFQQKGAYALAVLRQLVQERVPASGAGPLLDSLRLLVGRSDVSLGKLLPLAPRLNADYQANQGRYSTLFGEQLLFFRQVFEMMTYANLGISRDDVATRLTQFLTTEGHLEHEKLYGLWGYTHVMRANVNGSATLSGLLQKAGRKVVTMPIMTKDSRMLVHRDNVPFVFRKAGQTFVEMTYLDADGRVFGIDGFSELLPVTQANQTTLIKLNAPGSPYAQQLKLVKIGGMTGVKIKPDDPNTVTTNYFQYVFVVRNSPAVTLWTDPQSR